MTSKITRRHILAAAATAGVSFFPRKSCAELRTKPRGRPVQRDLIIDSHVHLKHGDAARTEYSPEAIVATMNKVGIDKSVVFAMSTTTRRSIEMAEAAVKKYPDRLIPYVYALPHYERPVIREIEEALARRRFRGIKIHFGECTLADYVVDPVLRLAGQRRVPCLIDVGGNLTAVERMARSEAHAIKKLFDAEAEPLDDGMDYIEICEDLGLPEDKYPELAQKLRSLGVTVKDYIPSIRSIEEVD